MDAREQAMKFLDRTREMLRPLQAGVRRTYEVSTLKIEIAGLRRSLDDVARELGRRAIDVLREHGQLSTDDVSALLRRVDDLEDRVAQKERAIADVEREDHPQSAQEPPQDVEDPDATAPGKRRAAADEPAGARRKGRKPS